MSTQTVSAAPRPTLSAELLAFAREQGVEQYLPELIEWARQVYPSATRFEVFVEDDAETDDRYIVFELDVPFTVEQSLEAKRHWMEGLFRIVPTPLLGVFRHSDYPSS
jgi:hypothetical protein